MAGERGTMRGQGKRAFLSIVPLLRDAGNEKSAQGGGG
jgi:hypothetical protein